MYDGRSPVALLLLFALKQFKNNVVVLFQLSRLNAATPWTVTAIYDELKCRDTTALKHLMSGYVASPATSAVALKMPSIPALCAALTSKVKTKRTTQAVIPMKSRGREKITKVVLVLHQKGNIYFLNEHRK